MEQNGTGDNDSEILRDIEDIINVTAISQMTTQQQNLNFQQPARQTQQPIHPPHITHLPPSTSSPAFVNIPNTMPKEAHKQNKIRSDQKPYIRIIEQPSSNPFRFRYPCEGRTAGKIPGANSTEDKKTFPTVEIVGYTGEVLLVVSCVTKDEPYKPHPHNLVGKDCKDGICRMTLKGEPMRACFSNLGIQCAKKNDVTASLDVRERIDVDPFNTRFDHKNRPSEIDLNTVRLCFQAFYNVGGSRVSMEPVVSDKIYKNSTDLIITRLCSCAAKVGGGDEIILLCEKVNKDDIKIRFIEVEDDNTITWEAFGEFNQQNVHKQTAIAFRTPRYKSTTVNDKAKVFIQLLRPSDGMTSKALPFEFFPDPDELKRKRSRLPDANLSIFNAHHQNRRQTPPQQFQNDFNRPSCTSFQYPGTDFVAEIKPEPLFLHSDGSNMMPMTNNMNLTFMNALQSVTGTSGGTLTPLGNTHQANNLQIPQQQHQPTPMQTQPHQLMNLNKNILPNSFVNHNVNANLPPMPNFFNSSIYTPLDQQQQTQQVTMNIPQNNMFTNYQTQHHPQQAITPEQSFMPWHNITNEGNPLATSPMHANGPCNLNINGNCDNAQGQILGQGNDLGQGQDQPPFPDIPNNNDDLNNGEGPTLSGILSEILDEMPLFNNLSNLSINDRSPVSCFPSDPLRNSG